METYSVKMFFINTHGLLDCCSFTVDAESFAVVCSVAHRHFLHWKGNECRQIKSMFIINAHIPSRIPSVSIGFIS